jgi:hypothetical protein
MENDEQTKNELAKIRYNLRCKIQSTRQRIYDNDLEHYGYDLLGQFNKKLNFMLEIYQEDDLSKAKEQYKELEKMERTICDTLSLFMQTQPRRRELTETQPQKPQPEPIIKKLCWFLFWFLFW